MIVCLEFFIPLETFSLIYKCHHCQWRVIASEGLQILTYPLMAIEQWGFFSGRHLLWQGASVYNGHLRGPVTHTPIAECLAVELTLPVLTTLVCRGWDSNSQLFTCWVNALTHCATVASLKFRRSITPRKTHEKVILENMQIFMVCP